MEIHMERESGALGGLFQQVIHDMKNGMPLWEDLITKAAKLHSSLKSTILAVTAYLEAFQRIADSATNARGATREIGTALTRLCLRHKAVEARMKTFTSTIMEFLILPLQDKLEDWKRNVFNLDKEHTKDYKKARTELKKRSTDTLRIQKKIRKCAGGDLQKRLECGLQDVTERRQLLEETEKHAVRAALIEERGRFCTFVGLLKPVVDEEIAMLTEISHLQEAVQQLEKQIIDPNILPTASEQVIADLKSSDNGWSFQTPPSSPSSLGSRKSSMCSISSLNSSSSNSSKSNLHSPNHQLAWQRSISQPLRYNSGTLRYKSISSQDSGFTSQDPLYPRPASFNVAQVSNLSENSGDSSSSSTPCSQFPPNVTPITTSTWPNLQETVQFERAASAILNERPHTISSVYEKGLHQRPPLTVNTFQAVDQSLSQPVSPVMSITTTENSVAETTKTRNNLTVSTKSCKPPLPTRHSSLERPCEPKIAAKTIAGMQGVRVLPPPTNEISVKKSQFPPHLLKDVPQPTYVNTCELNKIKTKVRNVPESQTSEKLQEGVEKDSSTSESSLESSSGYGSQTTVTVEEQHSAEDVNHTSIKYHTLPRNDFGTVRKRPVSMTALYSSATMRNTLLRRGSMQAHKPPPPIRRTSSITNTCITDSALQQSTSLRGSLENLPPPPAFLLEPSTHVQLTNQSTTTSGVKVADTVKALTELKHTPASPNSVRRISNSTQSIYKAGKQQNMLSTFQNQLMTKVSYVSQSGGIVYAQPMQIIASNVSGNNAETIGRVNSFRSQNAEGKTGPGGVRSSFMASLSAKLTPTLSPRSSRRNSDEGFPHSQQQQQKLLNQRGPGQSFLDSLNVKLAQQHLTANNTHIRANKVRQIINSKTQPDPKVCHESLMDQIKRGATLKHVKVVSDRSAPKIH